jgi:hypothetical protein
VPTEAEQADTDADGAPAGPVYVYKPSLMGAMWGFEIKPAGLAWEFGRHSGVVPYERIERVRLSFRPMTMQSYRFVTEVWAPEAPKLTIVSATWRSMVEQGRQDDEYNAFVRELHRRIAAANGRARFDAGMNPVLFWFGIAIFVCAALGLAALAVRAMQVGEWAGAGLVGGFFALFAWQIGTFLRRNRPLGYRPDALPAEVMPREAMPRAAP